MTDSAAVPVLHVASHEINVGDGALIGVVQDRLRQVAREDGDDVAFENFDIVDLEPEYGGASLPDLSPYGLVLVGGGGTIDNRRTRSASGMAFPLSGDDIRRCPTPLAFVAIGYNLFGGTRLRHADALTGVLRACAERGFPFSVRNDGSLARLREAVGDAARDVVEVPDPGFFVEADPDHVVAQFTGRRPRVLVQVAGDNPGFRHATGDLWGRVRNHLPIGLAGGLVRRLAGLAERLVEDHGAEVVLVPHIASDLALVARILERLPTRIRRKRVRVLGIAHPSRAAQFFTAYAQADLVVGMRGHAVICALGLGTPCLGLSTHPKVRGFMESCDAGDQVMDGRAGVDEMERHCAELLADPEEHLARVAAATEDFGVRLDGFLERCWERAEGSDS